MSSRGRKTDKPVHETSEEPGTPEEVEAVEEPSSELGVEELRAENERLLDRLMRLQAEFENYRKRVDRERVVWGERAQERLVLDLLPVQDSFDRAIDSAGESSDAVAVLEGLKLVHRMLVGALKKHGVEAIEAIGRPFDPKVHEALTTRPVGEGEDEGAIVEEVGKGYRMGDRTIRATRGIVAVAPDAETGSPASPEEE